MNTVSKVLFLTSLVFTLGLTTTSGTPPTSDKPTKFNSAANKLSGKTEHTTAREESNASPIIEILPTFQGGDLETFRTWFGRNLSYPQSASENGIQGNVTASFIIKPNGNLSDIQILSSPDQSLSNEVVRVLNNSPKWTPAVNTEGEPTEMFYLFPVHFRCQ